MNSKLATEITIAEDTLKRTQARLEFLRFNQGIIEAELDRWAKPTLSIFFYGSSATIAISSWLHARGFNTGEVAAALESSCLDPDEWVTEDRPEENFRQYIHERTLDLGGVATTIRHRLEVHLTDNASCKRVLEGIETRLVEKWVTVEESVPTYRFVCPEDSDNA